MDSTVPSTTRTDVYRTITDKIVAAIEHGAEAFVMPLHCAGPGIVRPTNAATRAAYQGVNVVALWAEASLAGYGSGHWATYKQWAGLKAQTRPFLQTTAAVYLNGTTPEDRFEVTGQIPTIID